MLGLVNCFFLDNHKKTYIQKFIYFYSVCSSIFCNLFFFSIDYASPHCCHNNESSSVNACSRSLNLNSLPCIHVVQIGRNWVKSNLNFLIQRCARRPRNFELYLGQQHWNGQSSHYICMWLRALAEWRARDVRDRPLQPAWLTLRLIVISHFVSAG